MKSRTSSFKTALGKNITRFAPVWGLYTLLLAMILLLFTSDEGYWRVRNMADWIMVMPVMNLFYALLTAQVLFGDLYNSRMCNALHAMPLRRETLFGANVTAGMLFSLVPTLVTALLALPICSTSYVIDSWQVPLYWFLGSNLSYLCFFGIAVLCVYLTGNRNAMAVVYAILNFASVITYWLVDTLYTPMLRGVYTAFEPFRRLTPVVVLASDEYLDVTRHNWDDLKGAYEYADFTLFPERWNVLLIWAAVGAVLMGLALVLYRKRDLERAGDFMVFQKTKPVFLVIYTLIVATCFQFVASQMWGGYADLAYLFVGLAVGWFTGLMLLERTIRVFRWKSVGKCAVLMACVAITLAATALDVFGIASWMPEPSQVKTAYVDLGYSYSADIPSDAIALTDDADLEKVLRLHELGIAGTDENQAVDTDAVYPEPTIAVYSEPITVDDIYVYTYYDSGFTYTLIYELEDGRTVRRYYTGYAWGEAGEIVTPWFSSLEYRMEITEADLPQVAKRIYSVWIQDMEHAEYLTEAQCLSLLEAVAADCRAGNMVASWSFHMNEAAVDYIEIGYSVPETGDHWVHLTVYESCENLRAWLEENISVRIKYGITE